MILLNGIEVTVITFPNKEVSIRYDGPNDFDMNRVVWTYESNQDFLLLKLVEELLLTKDFKTSMAKCTITYMPYSRMDRAHNGHPFSLRGVIEMLPTEWEYTVIEPHSHVTVDLLESLTDNDVNVVNPSYDILKRELAQWEMFDMGINGLNESVYIVFPDKGAYDRAIYYGLIEELKDNFGDTIEDCILLGKKSRGWVGDIEGLQLSRLDGNDVSTDVSKMTAFVVDDLVSYGGTFYRVVELIRSLGVNDVRLIATHLEDSVYKGELTTLGCPIHGTDSMGITRRHDNVHVDSLIDTYPELFRNIPVKEVTVQREEGEE